MAFRRLIADAIHFERAAVGEQADLLALAESAVHDAGENDDAAVWIKPGIENQRAQRSVGITGGRGHALDHSFECFLDANAIFSASHDGVGGIEADHLFNLFANALRLGRRQINLIDHRNNFEIVVDGQIRIRQRLRLNALRGIDNEQCAFASLQAARDFVGEIDVAGRVNQVQLIHVAVVSLIVEADGVGFDGDAALPLEVHAVEHLGHHFALRQRAPCIPAAGLQVWIYRDRCAQ